MWISQTRVELAAGATDIVARLAALHVVSLKCDLPVSAPGARKTLTLFPSRRIRPVPVSPAAGLRYGWHVGQEDAGTGCERGVGYKLCTLIFGHILRSSCVLPWYHSRCNHEGCGPIASVLPAPRKLTQRQVRFPPVSEVFCDAVRAERPQDTVIEWRR